ncbi:DNA sulfur modification protein DndE [Allobacillus sp. GCM10007491]|uniref:DNA sulfur modification protein DndE n=1 Tax=Allobacillus saliphilus TaxID=2912308 RepID=A0A941HT60_9BACI|nr:DNA sulfur modification protein DndE [Allobacillus saliphilus]MBR7553627.1 DNA sulfur modification protein DndE [Allobacillus saliphilus]
MNFRLRTSSKTAEKLKSLQASTKLTPNILSRLAVSLSLKIAEEPQLELTDTSGLEFNRNTLTGEHDYVFKALITQRMQKEISDEEFFPDLFNAHLERGITILDNEYRHAGNPDRFINNLLKI